MTDWQYAITVPVATLGAGLLGLALYALYAQWRVTRGCGCINCYYYERLGNQEMCGISGFEPVPVWRTCGQFEKRTKNGAFQ